MQRRLALAGLLFATIAIYLPLSVLRGTSALYGWDYMMLHARRLAFARQALLKTPHRLPGWYPREMLGTPFAANLQDFPWIPTHWPLLLFDPGHAYAVGIVLAAVLAAVFTYLFCRRAGLSPIGAAAAGWTFACAGVFASSVMVGHLVNLEGYPALPFLLWLADRALAPDARRRDVLILAIGTACVVVAGHPQLPAYAVAAALLYVIWRSRGRLRVKLCGAVALGIGITMAAWWPMLLLIRRSSRALPLEAAANDVVLPYHRLLGLILPGIDGWPDGVRGSAGHLFAGYSPYFWDTFAYVGILPLVAAVVLVVICVVRRRMPESRWMFLGAMGVLALLAALPVLNPLQQTMHATLLRSPSRLLYVCSFSLAAALGAGVDALLRWKPLQGKLLGCVVVALGLFCHAWDLGHVSRRFVTAGPLHPLDVPEFSSELGNGRIAVSRILDLQLSYQHDDAGGFDAIFLGDTYRELLALTGAPAASNEEVMDASRWPVRALESAGVTDVIPWGTRNDLPLVKDAGVLHLYRVPNPAPLSNGSSYRRPGPDRIDIGTSFAQAGVVHVLEAYDPGWTASVDGVAAAVTKANGLGMDIAVPAGQHMVRLRYRTPGRQTGVVLSLASLVLLIGLLYLPASNTAE
jgi:hypothetical protein